MPDKVSRLQDQFYTKRKSYYEERETGQMLLYRPNSLPHTIQRLTPKLKKATKVQELEKEIDGFVYKLYGLTDEEKKLWEEMAYEKLQSFMGYKQ